MMPGYQEQFTKTIRRLLDQTIYSSKISEESPFFPSHLHIEPTNACNLRCIHCHHHLDADGKHTYPRKPGFMSMELYHKVMDEIRGVCTGVTLDVQGEPLLHPDCLKMVELAKTQGLHTSLLTNATLLTEEKARAVVDLKLDRIVFSFDSIVKKTFEEIRVRATFEPTLRNILRFMKINQEARHPVHVCMSVILQERTRDEIDGYRDYFRKLPVDKIFVSNLLNLCGASGISDEIDMDELRRKHKHPICRVPWENLVVNWDGLVTTCPIDVNVVWPVGDLNKESLQDIWNNDAMRTIRRAHLQGRYSEIEKNGTLCSQCNSIADPEYDMRHFRDFAVRAIYRNAVHFAPRIVEQGASTDPIPMSEKEAMLDQEIAKLETE